MLHGLQGYYPVVLDNKTIIGYHAFSNMNMNKYIQIIITLVIAAVALILPNVAFADGGCTGQYGQAVQCPTPKPEEHIVTDIDTGIGDVINPLTVGMAFTGAATVLYYKARKSTLA